MEKRKNKSLIFEILGFLILSIVLFVNIYYFVINEKTVIKEDIKIEEYIQETNTELVENTDAEKTKEETKQETPKIEYLMVLEIPKINLKKGLNNINSKYNNVSYNIQILKESSMPDVEIGNLILAGHNGSSSVSFFRNLEKLKKDNDVFIYYNGFKYRYKIDKFYDVNKTGKVSIKRESKTSITLITCKKGTNDKQVVYIGYLVDKQAY